MKDTLLFPAYLSADDLLSKLPAGWRLARCEHLNAKSIFVELYHVETCVVRHGIGDSIAASLQRASADLLARESNAGHQLRVRHSAVAMPICETTG